MKHQSRAIAAGKTMRRVLTTTIATATVMLIGASAALAEECHGNGVDNGEESVHEGAGTSTQYMAWELGAGYGGRGVSTFSTTASNMSTDICLDSIFDWETTSGHFDARIARNCDPGSTRQSDSGGDHWQPDDDWGVRNLTGLQKGAGCKYHQVSAPGHAAPYYIPADCEYIQHSETGCQFDTAVAWNAYSLRSWLRRQDGTIDYNSGGDVDDPNG